MLQSHPSQLIIDLEFARAHHFHHQDRRHVGDQLHRSHLRKQLRVHLPLLAQINHELWMRQHQQTSPQTLSQRLNKTEPLPHRQLREQVMSYLFLVGRKVKHPLESLRQ